MASKKKSQFALDSVPNRKRSEICCVIYYKWFASLSKCIIALLNLKTQNACRDAQTRSKSVKDQGSRFLTFVCHSPHHHCPFFHTSSIICLFLNFCTAYHVRTPSHMLCSGFTNALTTRLAAALLIHPESSPARRPASHRAPLPCAHRKGEKLEQPSYPSKSTSVARSPEKEQHSGGFAVLPFIFFFLSFLQQLPLPFYF